MVFIAFGRWSSAAGGWFIRERIYYAGKWTPFVKVKRRKFGDSVSLDNFEPSEIA